MIEKKNDMELRNLGAKIAKESRKWVEVEEWIESRPRQTYMAPPEKRKRKKRKRLAGGDR